MVGSTGTLMTMRLVRSKLRKREETSAVCPPSSGRLSHQVEAHHNHHNNSNHNHHQQHVNQTNINNHHNNINSNHHQNSQNHQFATITTTVATISSQQQQQQNQVLSNENGIIHLNSINNGTFKQEQPQENGWVFPPLPPQPNIYCMNTTDALAHLQDKSGFKRFRTQFSGRFKRLVAKKTQEPPVIPPELRPQLKTIYVY